MNYESAYSPVLVEVDHMRGTLNFTDLRSVLALDEPFRIACRECGGTGWWAYGPHPSTNGPCVDCKGTGLVWAS